jgi:hypothetical protein
LRGGDSPSAQAAAVVDEADALDLAEAGEDALELLGGDLVEQVADVEVLAGRDGLARAVGVAEGAVGAARAGAGLLLGGGLEGVGGDRGRLVGRVDGGSALGGRQAILERRLCDRLGKVVGCLCGVVRGKAALEGGEGQLLLAGAGSGGDCGEGARRGDEGLGGSGAERAGGGAAEEKPGAGESEGDKRRARGLGRHT